MDARDLLDLATGLTRGLADEDRYRHLIAAVERVIPCEAAALLRYDGRSLTPVAWTGLVPEIAGRRFHPQDHPRLARILASAEADGAPRPVRFAPDSDLPDPWDGLMQADPHACARVHACMGCPLVVDERVLGLLTVDARDPQAFDRLDDDTLATFAAMAAATLHTGDLIDALETATRRQGAVLRRLAEERGDAGTQLLGSGAAMRALRQEIDLVAASDLAVLITGETGVGKELAAQAIHAASARRDEAMVSLNCAALPEHLVESQLFGHLRGAFTGADSDRAGVFEVADGGTVFLDEVGELPLAVQAKLLRTLQQGEIQRLGADRPLRVDVRVIAATNRDLEHEQAAGRFRSDLYYRLAVFPLRVPPLRERREDIPLIAGAILEREARRLGRAGLRLDEAARRALVAAPWPGNVRELEHVLMRAAVRAGTAAADAHEALVLRAVHLDIDAGAAPPAPAGTSPPDAGGVADDSAAARFDDPGRSLRERQDAFTRSCITAALARHGGTWAAAARELGLTPSNLQRLASRLGLR